MRLTLWPIAVTLLGLALCAQAGPRQKDTTHRYRWIDSTGLVHFSDSLNRKALSHGYDVLDANGRAVRHVPGQDPATAATTTPDPTQPQITALQQEQRDRQLLTAYPTEDDFKAAQQARLDDLDRDTQTIRTNLQSQEDNLTHLLTRAAGFNDQGQDVPKALQQRIHQQRQTVAEQQQKLRDQQARKSAANRQAATELAHYRALRARQQARYSH